MADEQMTMRAGSEELEPSGAAVAEAGPTATPPVQPTSGLAPALGKAVGLGMVWMVVANLLTKGASFITFALVATVLNERDIGIWTLAFSFAAFTQFFRDGGLTQLLIQRGAKQYESIAGPVFWLALVFNVSTALLLACLAPFAAGPNWYNEPELVKLLWVMAATMPFATVSTVLWAKLQADMRFGTMSRLALGTAFIRYGGTLIGIFSGWGAMSFVLPMPVAALYETIAFYLLTRDKVWAREPKPAMWWPLFNEGKWMIFVTFAFAVVNQGPYFLIGKLITTEQVGVFSFAYGLVGQIDQLLAATVQAVLFPALAKLNDEPERQRAATLRAAQVTTLLASVASFGLLVVVEPLESLVWGTKWVEAVVPAQITALVFAWRVLLWVPSPALQARGLFRFSAMLALFAGLGLMACAAIGAKLGGGNPVTIAWWMAGCNGLGFLAMSLWGMARVGVRPLAVLQKTVPPWVCCGVAAAAAMGVYKLTHPLITARLHDRVASGADVLVTGTVFTVLAYLLMRWFAGGALKELGGLVPARLAFVKRFL